MQDGPFMVQDLNEVPENIQQGQLNLNLPPPEQDINQDLHSVIFIPVMPKENVNGLQIDRICCNHRERSIS